MKKRPRSVTIISGIFIAFGGIALLTSLLPPVDTVPMQDVAELKAQHPFESAPVYVARILAVLCGVFMLYGFNWARWLLVVWMGFHVVVGVLHSPFSFLVHSLLFAVLVYFLFRPAAAGYFRGTKAEPQG
jgi:hypothetical protein